MSKDDDAELKALETQLEAQLKGMGGIPEDSMSSYGNPSPEEKDSFFKFFRDILDFKEPWKVGNLKDTEIGPPKLSIRANLELSQYSEAEGMELVSEYFKEGARIVAAPTMGRKGFIAQLAVTQIKKEQKLKTPDEKKKK